MPVYDFQCRQCKAIFEVRATFKEKEAGLEPVCPRCQSKKSRQLLSSPLFVLPTHEASSPSSGGCAGCGSGDCGHCHR